MTDAPSAEDSGHRLAEVLTDILADCVIVDCETTGLDPQKDEIIEITALRVRSGRPVAVFHRLVDPGRPLDPVIVSLTGLTDDALTGHGTVDAVLDDAVRFLAGGPVVGHNVAFDLSFIDRAIAVHRTLPRPDTGTLCTAETARTLVPRSSVGRYRLSTLAEALGLDHRPSHRAVDDVLATLDLVHHLADVSRPTAAS